MEKYYTPQDYKRFNIIRFDSATVTLSAKLLKEGMSGSGYPKHQPNHRRQVKFAVGFNSSCVVNSKTFFDQVYYSQDVAFSELILETSFQKNDILLFDRRLSGKQQLKDMINRGISFGGRLKENMTYIRCNSLSFSAPQAHQDDTLGVIEDCLMHRMQNFRKPSDIPFRLIICRIKQTGRELRLITNILAITALEAAQIYRLRWDIELFFKFIKQPMHFGHFLSRKEHTIYIAMYMNLIRASMIYVYRSLNQIEVFKIAKLRFRYELTDLLVDIITEVNENQRKTRENWACPCTCETPILPSGSGSILSFF